MCYIFRVIETDNLMLINNDKIYIKTVRDALNDSEEVGAELTQLLIQGLGTFYPNNSCII